MFGNIHVVKTVSVLDILIFLQNCGLSSPFAGGYWEFHRGKPVPFGNLFYFILSSAILDF